ncbi:transposase [Rhodococcus sp. DSM 6344]|nr:transposase [Rhodococcus erythropolis]
MPEHLTAAARARHTETRARADAALLALSNAGEPVTFAAVARRAKVSTDFLYNQPDLRTKINDLRTRRPHRRTTPEQMTEPGHQSASSVVRVLSSQLKELRRRHAIEVGELRKALEVAQGENLVLRRRLRQRNS